MGLPRNSRRQLREGIGQATRLGVCARQAVHGRLEPGIDGQRLSECSRGVVVSPRRGEFIPAGDQPCRLALRHAQQASQLDERIVRVIHPDVDYALDRGFRLRIERPDDQDARRLHTAGVAALRLSRIEGCHQAVGHRALRRLVGPGHGLDHGRARQRVALCREVEPADMPGVIPQMHGVFGIVVAADDAPPGVDGRPSPGVDDRHLPRIAPPIFVGDALDDVLWRETLLEQRDGLWSVETVGGGLRGDSTDAGLGPRHRCAGTERPRLHADTHLAGCGVDGDD